MTHKLGATLTLSSGSSTSSNRASTGAQLRPNLQGNCHSKFYMKKKLMPHKKRKKKRKSLLIYTTPDKQSAQTCGCHSNSMQSMRLYFIHVCTESYAPDSRPQLSSTVMLCGPPSISVLMMPLCGIISANQLTHCSPSQCSTCFEQIMPGLTEYSQPH